MAAPADISEHARGLLALTLIKGMGPVRIARLIDAFGTFDRIAGAPHAALARVPGIGDKTAAALLRELRTIGPEVDRELERIDQAGAHLVTIADENYPTLLRAIPAAPPMLTVRGRLAPHDLDRYPVAMVGSRECTHYGVEQAARFAGSLARSGLTVVSGGARGIDTAAHRGAMDAGGRTIAVLGCGIAKCYPPENAALFDRIADGHGAVISELPSDNGPSRDNFPARNRIISGLALGVLVIEAGRKSGALITARHAADDHGREVMGLPGRVDSPASEGTHDLLRQGAHLVCEPSDVIAVLEGHARHLHAGTHDAITTDPARPPLFDAPPPDLGGLTDLQRAIVTALAEPRTADDLAETLDLDAGKIRSELTMLEIAGRVRRAGSRFERV